MRKQSLVVASALAVFGLVPAVAQATLIAYEGFEVAQGTGVTVTGGTGWKSANWGSNNMNIGAGMTQGALQTAGNGFMSTSPLPIRWWADANRLTQGSTFWVSALINTSGGGSGGFDILQTDWNQPFTFGNNWGATYSVNNANTGVAINQQVFLLTRIELIPDAVDANLTDANIYVWAYPASDSSKDLSVLPSDASANATVLGYQRKSGSTNLGIGTLQGIRLLSATTTNVDEIRVGTTWADVVPVPEPASLGTLGLAAAGLLAGRRRRTA